MTAAREIEGGGFAGASPRRATLDDLIGIVDQVRGGAISLVIAFSIAAVDMLSPATFNLPIF